MRTLIRVIRRNWWWLLPGIALLAIAFGVIGFSIDKYSGLDPLKRFGSAFLKTLQLFVTNVPPEELKNWQAWAAAMLAVLASAGALIAAITVTIGEHIVRASRLWRLRRWPARDIFIGDSEIAAGIALHRQRAPRPDGRPPKLVGLALRHGSLLSKAIGQRGTASFMLNDEVVTTATLRRMQLHRARNIWIGSSDDHQNVAVASQVLGVLKRKVADKGEESRILISVSDPQLARLEPELFPIDKAPGYGVEFFALTRMAARALLRRFPPRWRSGTSPHIAVAGCGTLSEALVAYIAQHCVYSDDPRHCVRITLLGRDAAALRDKLVRRTPALRSSSDDPALGRLLPLVSLTAQNCDPDNVDLDTWRQAQKDDPFDAIYVACTPDMDSLSAAVRMASLREVDGTRDQTIVACRQQIPGSAGALPAGNAMDATIGRKLGVNWFDVHGEVLAPDENYPGEKHDARAMLVHLAYESRGTLAVLSASDAARKARTDWLTRRNDAFRWSDRLAADHIDVKLEVKRRLESSGASAAAIMSALARLEHRRFVAERLIDGWLPLAPSRLGQGPSGLDGREQKVRLHVNCTLAPFEELSPEEREKDERIASVLPELLRAEASMKVTLS